MPRVMRREIIFGAVHDSSMSKEIRVTVIATGFEKGYGFLSASRKLIRADFGPARVAAARPVPEPVTATPHPALDAQPSSGAQAPERPDILTFIRRQMD